MAVEMHKKSLSLGDSSWKLCVYVEGPSRCVGRLQFGTSQSIPIGNCYCLCGHGERPSESAKFQEFHDSCNFHLLSGACLFSLQ